MPAHRGRARRGAAVTAVATLVVASGCGSGARVDFTAAHPAPSAAPAAQAASSRPGAPAPPTRAPSPPSDRVVLGGGGGQSLGQARAPVVMVELTDYECPFCRRYQRDTFPLIKQKYVDTGKVRYVVRDLPLDIHPHAATAAEVARCAAAQGKFWPMRQALLADREGFSAERYAVLAGDAGLAPAALRTCLDQGRFRDAVKADRADALAAGFDRTPSFVIGRETPKGIAGVRVVGAAPYSAFAARIEELLRAR